MSEKEIGAAANAIIATMSEDQIDPLVGMTAMMQLAAKIAFDSAQQDKLSPADGRDRWMGGAMLAYDGCAGGNIKVPHDMTQEEFARQVMVAPAKLRRHLSLCAGTGKGTKKGIRERRRKNKMARSSRRGRR